MAIGKNNLYYPLIGKQKNFYYERIIYGRVYDGVNYISEIRENTEYDEDNDEDRYKKVSYNMLLINSIIFGRGNSVMITNNGRFLIVD